MAVVGRTGSGKSTLANLLLRLSEVPPGAVLIDGHDINRIPLATLRQNLGYVPQENFLFSTTIAENVAFAGEFGEEAIRQAAQVAQIHRDILEFPRGYDTIVGERGVTLSGGQKQRVAIARALIKDPRILILDDCLSAVDTYTEEEILRGLRQVMRARTSIIISHRISTVQDADHIVVLDKGRIVERGTRATLVAQGGIYSAMYRRRLLEARIAEAG